MNSNRATLMAGIPATNSALYHALRFSVGDPAALITFNHRQQGSNTVLIIRDIEMERAKQYARADKVNCPADFEPREGLSGDRETATAQAVAECLRVNGIQAVVADRTLPLIFADVILGQGIEVICDREMGVRDRRSKDAEEIQWLREAQATTEGVMEMACRLVARATANANGELMHEGSPLTSERVRAEIDIWLLNRGYVNVPSIVASGPQGADCHAYGSGPLKTGEPIIIDIFPQNRATRYNGDCTRTVVHGEVSETLLKMHAAVVAAKQAGQDATRPGVTGESVHQAVIDVIEAHGYHVGLPHESTENEYCAMVHGTGHGIGLDVHEPPLLDFKGPRLVVGDALTIEPGLYCQAIGGIRLEDMVIVTEDGCESLNQLPEGLNWE
jgi:Xaa-Pro aminopeptidase